MSTPSSNSKKKKIKKRKEKTTDEASTEASETTSNAAAEQKTSLEEGDELFIYDEELHRKICDAKPWLKDPHYFQDVKVSATALIKMVMHARSGGSLEVMGIMVGKVLERTMVVTDSFALPVEGTETRVNAGAEAFEYMVNYLEHQKQAGRHENAIGWYHSHPGYGCWLSGIDVNTQMMNQQYQEPWLAIVIDPVRTSTSGKVTIGAFRTYPKDYEPANAGGSQYQSIPLSKIEDFGVHAKCYYPLEVSYFKSSLDAKLLDLLWNKYWVNTLSSAPFLTNRDYTSGQISDLAEKVNEAETTLHKGGGGAGAAKSETKGGKDASKFGRIVKDSAKIAEEQLHGLIGQVMKDILFNSVRGANATTTDAAADANAAAAAVNNAQSSSATPMEQD